MNKWLPGGFTLLLGIGTMWGGGSYRLGTLARMGPGYYPVLLGALLVIVGALMIATSRTKPEGQQVRGANIDLVRVRLRAIGCVVLAILLFIILGEYGGLVPATFALIALCALGDKKNSVINAVVLAAVVTVATVAIFHYGLNLQFPIFA